MAYAQGKTVIVTGAAGGLGKVIAETFLGAGANVVVCDIKPDRLTAVQEEWAKTYPEKYLAQETDVTDESAVQSLVDATVSRFGRLDILINNAGIMDDFSPVGACSKEKWDRVLNINLNGPYLASKAAINQFENQDPPEASGSGGVIINIGSTAGIEGFKGGAAYTASKHALVGLTKNTAGFYGPKGISCMAVLPGGMNTNIADAFERGMHMEAFQRIQASQTPFDQAKQATPLQSVAKFCLYLSDPDIAPTANGSCVVFNKNWPEA